MKKQKKRMKPRTRLRLLQVGGAATAFLPVMIAVGLNFNDYVATKSSAIGLTAGGAMAAAIVAIQMLGKGRRIFGNAVLVSGIAFVLAVLLEPLVLNLKLLTGMVFLGEAAYAVTFKPQIAKARKKLEQTEQAQTIKDVLKEETDAG